MSTLSMMLTMVRRMVYPFRYKNRDRDWDTWVFGEWFGNKCNDSSLALANHIARNDYDIRLYWIAKKGCIGIEDLDPKVTVVEMDSPQAMELLCRAGAVFVNEGLADLSGPVYNYSNGGVVVNLWHGVAWKKIGMDTYGPLQIGLKLYAWIIFKSQTFTYFVTASKRLSNNLKSAFLLKDKQLIKAGFPRNQQFHDEESLAVSRRKILSALRELNPDLIREDIRLIAYLPTFRDSGMETFSFLGLKSPELDAYLEEQNAVIVEKAHIADQSKGKVAGEGGMTRVIKANDLSAQELMAASDMLITDYSSCFYDFLILDRPVIHYIYDFDYYKNKDRGLYYEKEDVVCGDAPETQEDLVDAIRQNLSNPDLHKALRRKRRKQFQTYDGPDNCDRIIKVVLNDIENRRSHKARRRHRERTRD